MAVAITHLNTTTSTSSLTSLASGSVSPTGNALLVVVCSVLKAPGTNPTITGITDTFSGTGAWTTRVNSHNEATVENDIAIFTAQLGATPGSGAPTVSWTNACTLNAISVYEVTGFNTSAPVTQSKAGTAASTTPSLTLDSSPDAESLVFAAISIWDDTAVVPGANFTELVDVQVGVTPKSCHQTQYDLGSATTTVDWSGAVATNSTFGAIEIAVAVTSASVTLDPATATVTAIALANVDAPVSRTMDTATGTVTGIALTVSAPAPSATVTLDTATLTATGISASVDAPVIRVMATATLTATAIAIDVVPGAVSVILDAAAITATGIALSVDAPVTRSLDTATITATGIPLSIDAPITRVLDTASLTGTPIPITVSAISGVSVLLDTASITGTPVNAIVIEQVYVSLDTAILAGTGIGIDVVPGAVSIGLGTASLTALGIEITISALLPGQTISLDTATITGTGIGFDVVPGAVSITLGTASITVTGIDGFITTIGGTAVTLSTATVTVSATPIYCYSITDWVDLTLPERHLTFTLDRRDADFTLHDRWDSSATFRPAEMTYDYYVDSVNGSDDYTGITYVAPFKTIAMLLTVMQAGDSIALAKGSHWREQLTLPGNSCTVTTYGSGDRPILDASDVMTGWSKTVGQTYVYQITCTPEWYGSSKDYLNVWEDGDFLVRAANLAACDSTAGSYYPSGSSGEIALYVHATDGGDPDSNGSTYEYSHRKYGLTCYAYSGCNISGIETRKSLHNDGSLVVGQSSVLVDCASKYGNLHNVYVRTGSTLTDCIAQDAYCGTTALSLFVYNDNTPANEGITFINCQALCSSLNTYATGFYGHRNTSGSFGTVTYQGCTSENCGVAFNGIHATSVVALDSIVTGCVYGFRASDASPWTITGATVTGACSRVIETIVATTVVASYLDVDVVCNNSLLIYFTVASAITITDSNFAGASFAGANRIFYVSHASAVVSAARNVYHTGFAHVYAFLVIASFTSDSNCFDDNTENFNINGTTYTTVAAYQAGTGLDASSTIGGCAS